MSSSYHPIEVRKMLPRGRSEGHDTRGVLRVILIALLCNQLQAGKLLPHYSGCPNNCNAAQGGGSCVANACVCAAGYGAGDCSFSSKTLFFEHNIWDEFVPRPVDYGGWASAQSIYQKVAASINATFMVEVGTWKGMSASFLAGFLKEKNSGVLVCVDTWLGAPEFWTRRFTDGQHDPHRDMQLVNGYPSVYYSFLSNVVHMNLQKFIVPFPVPSDVASEVFRFKNLKADLIHVDGSHEYKAVLSDLESWWDMLVPGGILMGDDYNMWPGVTKAVDEFAARYGLAVTTEDKVFWLQKPKHRLSRLRLAQAPVKAQSRKLLHR